MKAYLAGSIFYDKDIKYNAYLAQGIRKAWPGIDMYVPQEATINDKTTFADSTMIYNGDYERLKETDLFIACVDNDVPPIGTVTEIGIFSELAKNNPDKHMVILHTDTRDAYKTMTQRKVQDMTQHQCASQFNYFNLFTRGVIETCGVIVGSSEQMFEYIHELYMGFINTHHISGIYLITNRLSGKKYIGQSVDIYRRLNSHRFLRQENAQAVDIAINKYGIENFTFTVLEECDENELDNREKYWCDDAYNHSTYAPNGYNIANAGGQYGKHPDIISSYTVDGCKVNTYKSKAYASDCIGVTSHAISQAMERNNLCQGLMWAYGDEEKIDPYCPNPKGKMIDLYDQEGKFICTFDNMTRASEFLNCNITAISQSCLYNQMVFGYKCVFHGEEFIPSCLYKTKKNVCQYDKDNHKFIKKYPNATIAAKEINLDNSGILKACKGQKYYYGGYIWSYIEFNEIPDNYNEINKKYWETIKNKKEEIEEDMKNDL